MRRLLFILVCLIAVMQAGAQQWRSIGPSVTPQDVVGRGGTLSGTGQLSAIAFSRQDTNKVFLGGGGGGVWLYDMHKDSAISLGFDTIAPFIGISALAVDPKDDKHIYAATGEPFGPYDFPDTWNSTTGIYITRNNGHDWHSAVFYNDNNMPSHDFEYGQFNYNRLPKIIINPLNPHTMWCVSHGFLYDANTDITHIGHIYISHDGGETWHPVKSHAFSDTYFTDIVYDARDTSVMYAASHLLYQSRDGGRTWIDITPQLAQYKPVYTSQARLVLSVSPAYCTEPMIAVLALFQDAKNNRLYITPTYFDSLVSPVPCKNLNAAALAVRYKYNLSLSGLKDTLYTGGNTIQASYDAGISFTKYGYAQQTHPDIHAIAVSPHSTQAKYVFVGTDGGLFISRNAGKSYTRHVKGFAVSMFYSVAASDTRRRIVAGTQDLGTFRCDNDSVWYRVNGGGDGNKVLIRPHSADTFIYGDFQDAGIYLTNNGGKNYTESEVEGQHYIPSAWVYNPWPPYNIYAGSTDVWRFTPGQLNPVRLSNFRHIDSARYDPGIVVTDIAVSPIDTNIMYASLTGQWSDSKGNISAVDKYVNYNDTVGYACHTLYKSVNGGRTWQDVTPALKGVPGEGRSIALSTKNKKRIWVTHLKWSSVNWQNITVYVSNNGGDDWYNYSEGLPAVPVNKIIATPDDVLYVATNLGVFMRKRNMDAWVNISYNIPHTPVKDVAYSPLTHTLYAATWGRGMWCIDTHNFIKH